MSTLLRQQKILELVQQHASVRVQSLIDTLNISPATIRRDLTQLEDLGKIIRTHGAVLDPARVEWEPNFHSKRGRAPKAKRRIGQCVSEQIPDGSSVFVDAGSTCLEAGIALQAREHCDIYTNSIPLLTIPARGRLTVIGGTVRRVTGALVGTNALEWLSRLRFDFAILGASSLDPEEGCYTTELTEAAVKRAAATRADQVIVVADHTKFQETAPIRFLEWSEVDLLAGDFKTPPLSTKSPKILQTTRNPT